MLFQQDLVGKAGILAATIRMMQQTRWWLPQIDRHQQGRITSAFCMRRSIAQPTTRREYRSMTTAR